MVKYILLLIPFFLLVIFIWAFNGMNYSNTLPTFQIWFSVFLSIMISVISIIVAIWLFKKDKTVKSK